MNQNLDKPLMGSHWIQQSSLGKTEVIICYIPCLFNHKVYKISPLQARIHKLLEMNIHIYMIPTLLQ